MASDHRLPLLLSCLLVLLGGMGARVQLDEAQALAQVFPAAQLRERVFELDDAQRERLSQALGYRVPDRFARFIEAGDGGRLLGHAIVISELGKSLPISFLVSIDPSGAVDQVVLMRFLEPRGFEVEQPAFRSQYRGKRTADPIRRGADIRNISGATISVDSMSRGVRRALALWQLLLAAPEQEPVAASGAAGAD